MTSDKDLKLICSVAVVLFLVGVLCYAAVPAKAPEDPIRIQYRSDLGNVTFQHSKHVASYGASCYDCHHHPGNDDIGLVACSVCHPKDAESPDATVGCQQCHDDAAYYEDWQVVALTDAAHEQCKACHAGFGAGPLDCSECHFK